jgi:hypothetical protein
MDPIAIITLIQAHLPTGHDCIVFLAGAALSNPGICALFMFNAALLVPGVKGYIARNPEKVKDWVDQFERKVDDLVDRQAAAEGRNAPKNLPQAGGSAQVPTAPAPPKA